MVTNINNIILNKELELVRGKVQHSLASKCSDGGSKKKKNRGKVEVVPSRRLCGLLPSFFPFFILFI